LLYLFLHIVGLLPDPFQGPHFSSHRVNPSHAGQPSVDKFGGVLGWIESADIFDLLWAQSGLPLLCLLSEPKFPGTSDIITGVAALRRRPPACDHCWRNLI
jgi:hypothetical protein